MKKIVLIVFTLGLFIQNSNAQILKKGRDKIKAFKIAYITEKLSLTSTEAEKFWPVYNDFDEKRRELFWQEKKELKETIRSADSIESISEQDAKTILNKIHDLQVEQHELRVNFHNKVSTFLPAKKILMLELAEHEFNRKLMYRLKDRR